MTTSKPSTSNATKSVTSTSGRTFTMERVFDAPRELVFRAYSEPKHLMQWWGPKEWTLPVCEVDFRPGGTWLYCMRGPDGMESWGRATYREIVPPERIVYVDAFADAQGNVQEGMPQMVITVEFIDVGGKTKLRSSTEFATVADMEQTVAMGMVEGINETMDRLEAYLTTGDGHITRDGSEIGGSTIGEGGKSKLTLPSEREIRMTRLFDAPRELVFRTLTDPALLAQWWGLESATTIIDQLDLRVGGKWRFVQRNPDGGEDAFRGEFREITPPSRMVQTFEWEGLPGHIVVETMTLEDWGGKTLFTTTSLFDSVEDRDSMLASGMESGANESWDRLARLLASQQA